MLEQYDHEKLTRMASFEVELEGLLGRLDDGKSHITNHLHVSQLFIEIAGESVSSHTKAVYIDRGKVTVVVDSGAWAQDLAFLAEEYRIALNEALGGEVVTAVTFCTRPMR